MMYKNVCLSALLCILIALLSFAEKQPVKKPDFTGEYVFFAEKSKLQSPVPKSATLSIKHQEPAFTLTRTLVFTGKPETWNVQLTTDGKEVVKEEKTRKLISKCYWDGHDLIVESKVIQKDTQETTITRYSLSDHGKTLTATEQFRGAVLKYFNQWIFSKR